MHELPSEIVEHCKHLNTKERQLLDITLDPTKQNYTYDDISFEMKISKQQLILLFASKRYTAALKSIYTKILVPRSVKILDECYRVGMTEGSKGFNDRKLYLQIAGFYSNDRTVTNETKETKEVTVTINSKIESLANKIAEMNDDIEADYVENEEE